jgi:hypothetical protein
MSVLDDIANVVSTAVDQKKAEVKSQATAYVLLALLLGLVLSSGRKR